MNYIANKDLNNLLNNIYYFWFFLLFYTNTLTIYNYKIKFMKKVIFIKASSTCILPLLSFTITAKIDNGSFLVDLIIKDLSYIADGNLINSVKDAISPLTNWLIESKPTFSNIEIPNLPQHGFKGIPSFITSNINTTLGTLTPLLLLNGNIKVILIPPIVNIKAILLFTIFLFGPLILVLAGYITKAGAKNNANNYSQAYKDSKGGKISILNPSGGSSSSSSSSSAGDNNGNDQGNNGGNNNGRNNKVGIWMKNILRNLINTLFEIIRRLQLFIYPAIRDFITRISNVHNNSHQTAGLRTGFLMRQNNVFQQLDTLVINEFNSARARLIGYFLIHRPEMVHIVEHISYPLMQLTLANYDTFMEQIQIPALRSLVIPSEHPFLGNFYFAVGVNNAPLTNIDYFNEAVLANYLGVQQGQSIINITGISLEDIISLLTYILG